MSAIEVQGLVPIKGEIWIQGSKNAVLPVMAAAILHKGKTVIDNVPRIQDVYCMMGILEVLGCKCSLAGHELTVDAENLSAVCIPREDMEKMRSSIVLMGPLLGRTGEAAAYHPGGCSIGERPIDLHLLALEKLGALITEENGKITAKAKKLSGGSFHFSFPSVGATENALMAAVMAEGDTVLTGCAMEPEITELCHFLTNMGASIEGIGSSRLTVRGGMPFADSKYRVGGDRIVAGTYMTAAVMTMGKITVEGVKPEYLSAEIAHFQKMGAKVSASDGRYISLEMPVRPAAVSVKTGPYPGFPTDLQSPIMAALCVSAGNSVIEENIFEGRFKTADELRKLGALISISDRNAHITGAYPLLGGQADATDLRGGAALVLAGLSSEEVTRVGECQHIYRGYEDICRDLKSLGARIAAHN